MFSQFQANSCWSEASTLVILRNWYSRWGKRWQERFWRKWEEEEEQKRRMVGIGMERYSVRDRERGKKADNCAGGRHSVTWDRKRGGVTLPIISHACGPPGRLNTRLFSACRGELPQEEGESGKDRVRVTRTTLLKSPGKRVTHSEMLLSWRGGA